MILIVLHAYPGLNGDCYVQRSGKGHGTESSSFPETWKRDCALSLHTVQSSCLLFPTPEQLSRDVGSQGTSLLLSVMFQSPPGAGGRGAEKQPMWGLSAQTPLPAPLESAELSQQMVLLAHASAEQFCKRNNQGKTERGQSWRWEPAQTQAHTDQGISHHCHFPLKAKQLSVLLSYYCPAFLH